MSGSRLIRYLLCFALLFGVLVGMVENRVVLANQESSNGSFLLPLNQEQPPPEEWLELTCSFPVLKGRSGDSFEFEIESRWHSNKFNEFDVSATGLPDWRISILGGYEKKEISGRIGLKPLEPGETYPTERITVRLAPLQGSNPDPGEYASTVTLSSGDIKQTIEVKAVVTALYRFAFYSSSGRLNTEVTAGEDNHFSTVVLNTGSAAIENFSLTSSKPSGWSVTFNPEKIESLEPEMAQEIDVVIKPPPKTVAGDYGVALEAYSVGIPMVTIQLRVTALTPTIWGWIGVLIVLAVIAGLAVMFRRLGRR